MSPTTRQAVLTALDVLGYERPTQLRGERARLVGLVLPELQNPIFPAFAEVVGGRARPARVHAGALHPDRRRHHRSGVRRAAARPAGVGRGVRRRPVRPGAGAATATTSARRAQPAGGAHQRRRRWHRLPAGVVRRRHGHRAGLRHLDALGHRGSASLLGPRRPRAVATASWPPPCRPRPSRHRAPASARRAGDVLARGRPGRRRPAGRHRGHRRCICASDPLALGAIRAVRRAGPAACPATSRWSGSTTRR